jgi:hypothetical protein
VWRVGLLRLLSLLSRLLSRSPMAHSLRLLLIMRAGAVGHTHAQRTHSRTDAHAQIHAYMHTSSSHALAHAHPHTYT